ncbi:MAG: hypothetical protein F6K47_37195 [Symploca sp. SIO2E6]|nr:hypothetical protein [Symploca sp. SIO2E6]
MLNKGCSYSCYPVRGKRVSRRGDAETRRRGEQKSHPKFRSPQQTYLTRTPSRPQPDTL